VLEFLDETCMIRCKPAAPQNHNILSDSRDLEEKSQYYRLVGRLIYISHTSPDIAYDVSVVS
jgi:hypothetical protein